jgi:hypothetical protein
VRARAQPTMRQQQRRRGARNEQHIVEPIIKKGDVAMRLDPMWLGLSGFLHLNGDPLSSRIRIFSRGVAERAEKGNAKREV